MEPWYKVATPRKEVREGRSFNPDEFAIALEQVVAGTAPEDYRKPEQFFARTCFTRHCGSNSGLVLRRLSGKTENTAPVLTLITQFGGGKTHTLTTLYHLANTARPRRLPGVADLLERGRVDRGSQGEGRGVRRQRLGPAAGPGDAVDRHRPPARGRRGRGGARAGGEDAPPGTDTINRLIAKVDGPVLLLFDEVLNLFNRHRGLAEPIHAFLQNIVRGPAPITGRR